jgi:tripartite-type tricarboxylate transporter receptor subunit TctC
VQTYFDNVPNLLQHMRSGSLRPVALAAETRDPQHPDIPTMAEAGYPDFVATYLNGMLAPAGTPAPVVARLNAAINDGLRSADMQATLRRLGAEPKMASVEEFGVFLVEEARKWSAVARAADIKVE